jgi:hypothetical protein
MPTFLYAVIPICIVVALAAVVLVLRAYRTQSKPLASHRNTLYAYSHKEHLAFLEVSCPHADSSFSVVVRCDTTSQRRHGRAFCVPEVLKSLSMRARPLLVQSVVQSTYEYELSGSVHTEMIVTVDPAGDIPPRPMTGV